MIKILELKTSDDEYENSLTVYYEKNKIILEILNEYIPDKYESRGGSFEIDLDNLNICDIIDNIIREIKKDSKLCIPIRIKF